MGALSAMNAQGPRLPGFVREEYDAYLGCGRLDRDFLRAKCTGCRYAHLVEQVLLRVPMRQWVVTFPGRCACCSQPIPSGSPECSGMSYERCPARCSNAPGCDPAGRLRPVSSLSYRGLAGS